MTKPQTVAVIEEALCIGCTLCIQACPVDCIRTVETGAQPTRTERRLAAERARRRSELRALRLARERRVRPAAGRSSAGTAGSAKQQTVQRAIERARQRLAQRKAPGN